jgi:hypothetical protein
MGSMFSPPPAATPPPPPPPPPPANPPTMANAQVQQAGAANKAKNAAGMGFNGTDITGGNVGGEPNTGKAQLLGGTGS